MALHNEHLRGLATCVRRGWLSALAAVLCWSAIAAPSHATLLLNVNPLPDPSGNSVLRWTGTQLITAAGATGNGDGALPTLSQTTGGLQIQTPLSIGPGLAAGEVNNLDGSTTFYDTSLVLTGLTQNSTAVNFLGLDVQTLGAGTFQFFSTTGNTLLLSGNFLTTGSDILLGGSHGGSHGLLLSNSLVYTGGLIYNKLVAVGGTTTGTAQFNLLLNNNATIGITGNNLNPHFADAQGLFDTPIVPEPTTWALGAMGLVGLVFCAGRGRSNEVAPGCYLPISGRRSDREKSPLHLALLDRAAEAGGRCSHFSETCLSGYPGVDLPSLDQLDWDELTAATRDIQRAAARHKLWVLLGSSHRLGEGLKPHNSIYVIDARGRIADRYDKRFCTGSDGKRATLDLAHYSPGNRATTFRIRGITCGVLICYDYRFPELYRELKQLGVQIVFQSFHNARSTPIVDQKYDIWRTIVPATMMCRAAENHFWISANNSQVRPARWGSFTVRPDGQIMGQLREHKTDLLLTDMTIDPKLYDAPGQWRDNAMTGTLHSGQLVEHPRSADRTCL